MYQSFPQKHISRSNNAMPVMKQKIEPVREEIVPEKEIKQEEKAEIIVAEEKKAVNNPFGDLFKNVEIDDLIIIGLILLMIYEGSDDWLTIGLLIVLLIFN